MTLGNAFLDMTKYQVIKKKIDWISSKQKILVLQNAIKKVKRQPKNERKYLKIMFLIKGCLQNIKVKMDKVSECVSP